ncbi:MAG: peptidoglycan DD-metalloendopeptidase family protein [Paracoccaceae bacterium]
MNKSNPLLHDYKPKLKQTRRRGKSKLFQYGIMICVISFLIINWSTIHEKPEPKLLIDDQVNVINQETVFQDTPQIIDALIIDQESIADEIKSEAIQQNGKIEIEIKAGDTLEELFIENNLNIGHLFQIMSSNSAEQYLKYLRPGDTIVINHVNGEVINLTRNLNLKKALFIQRDAENFNSSIIDRDIQIRKKFGYGNIKTSLFESAIENGLTEKLIMNLTDILAWDIDFVYDVRIDDDFYILFEEIWQDDKYVTDGNIIALEFNNNGRKFQAIRYTNENGVPNYFTPDGNNMSKAFIRAPLDFTRVSSNFNPNRKHPILNTIRAHRGVDYAAPKGTKIKASGDGKIIFRGVKSGYGNVIILQHGDNITTLYAHMSGFNSAFKLGDRVKQNQVIGYVGSSGLATAPHLHYEYRVNGIHKNPRTVKLPQAQPIKKEYVNDFLVQSKSIMSELLQFKESRFLPTVANN